jgi:16S rRNA (guanine966-N2)-methyltransferase
VRETLFNWLQLDVPGSRCLDLFAGSGVLGFEAASRGAAHVSMVESQRKVYGMLEKNRDLLHLDKSVSLFNRDALQWLKSNRETFDILFLDPPFNQQILQPVIDLLSGSRHLVAGAKIYIEQDVHEASPNFPEKWKTLREKKAGQVYYRLIGIEA